MPRIFILVIALALCTGLSTDVFAQNSEQKTQNLIAALGKTKYKKKEKKGISIEVYVDVKSEAVVKNNVRDYAGVYQTSAGDYRLDLRVASDGRAEGSGYGTGFMNEQKRNFTLRDAQIVGALLTATKIYADGRTEKLEAVFINRKTVEGKNPSEINSRETKYGLGFIDTFGLADGTLTNRVFLEFKP